jgi:hypothetical protein
LALFDGRERKKTKREFFYPSLLKKAHTTLVSPASLGTSRAGPVPVPRSWRPGEVVVEEKERGRERERG